jgi:hypothetical protein
MITKEVKRWLRALELAKILFEDQGYHTLYLQGIENFIRRLPMFTEEELKRRRKYMYSPKIDADLIPDLYKLARSRKIPMTQIVNRIIVEYLQKNGIMDMEGGIISYEPENQLGGLQGTQTASLNQGDPGVLRSPVGYVSEKR